MVSVTGTDAVWPGPRVTLRGSVEGKGEGGAWPEGSTRTRWAEVVRCEWLVTVRDKVTVKFPAKPGTTDGSTANLSRAQSTASRT